jgi:hypothetical protein
MTPLHRAAPILTRPTWPKKWPGPLGAFSPRVETGNPFPPFPTGGSPVDSGQPMAGGVVVGMQAQVRGGPSWGSGEEEAH